ncbi:MAG: hypothetical protein AAF802_04645 [Planctomycetota bacterium]
MSIENAMSMRSRNRSTRAAWLFAVCLLVLSGCAEEKGISVYTIPKQIPEQLKPGKDRMIVTMAPRGDQVWFFKLTGPEKSIATVESAVNEFVSRLTFDSDDEPVLEELPEGWNRGPKRPMRFATIDINTPGKQLAMSVSSLSLPVAPGEDLESLSDEDWEDYVKQNVDRWRGQLGLQTDKTEWGGGKPVELAWARGQGIRLDIVGEPTSGGMRPMAGMGQMSGMPPMSPMPQMPSANGTSVSPQRSGTVNPKLSGDAPDGWRSLSVSPGGMRLMAFEMGPKDAPAQLTVTAVGGSVRGNVARWLGQVKEGPTDDSEVDALMDSAIKVDVSERSGKRFIISRESGKIAIDGTVVPISESRSVFIKVTGPPDVVEAQRDKIAAFLSALSF